MKIHNKKAYGITFENEIKSISSLKKKVAMRIWGSNNDKIKKVWGEYVLNNESSIISIWISLYLLKINIDKFMKRKI